MNGLLHAATEFWLADSPEVRARCGELAGRTIAVELTDLELEFCVRPRDGGLDISRERIENADARIRARSADLLRMSRDSGTSSATGRLHIEGDAELAQAVRDLLRDVRFDPEERLARVIGDAPAHQLGRLVRGIQAVATDSAWRLADMAAEFLKYESRDLPRADEVERFVREVDELRDDVERAAARLEGMEK